MQSHFCYSVERHSKKDAVLGVVLMSGIMASVIMMIVVLISVVMRSVVMMVSLC